LVTFLAPLGCSQAADEKGVADVFHNCCKDCYTNLRGITTEVGTLNLGGITTEVGTLNLGGSLGGLGGVGKGKFN
jgi:hypothetical protein